MDKLTTADIKNLIGNKQDCLITNENTGESSIFHLVDSDQMSYLLGELQDRYKIKMVLKPLSQLEIPSEWRDLVSRNGYGRTIKRLEDIVITGNLEDGKKFLEYLNSEKYDVDDLFARGLAITQEQADKIMSAENIKEPQN